jgi:hypothetical protein
VDARIPGKIPGICAGSPVFSPVSNESEQVHDGDHKTQRSPPAMLRDEEANSGQCEDDEDQSGILEWALGSFGLA